MRTTDVVVYGTVRVEAGAAEQRPTVLGAVGRVVVLGPFKRP
ncbi:hypothetical protein [Streptomyces sp. CA-146814]